ncbi:MAG: hypothetical protein AAFR52_02320 [Pseudomonadota bacterium]
MTPRRRWRMLPALMAIALAAQPVAAVEPIDLLFETPHMQGVRPGAALSYVHSREGAHPVLSPGFNQTIRMQTPAPDGGSEAIEVTMDAEGAPRTLAPFVGVPGNPMLMVFLETVVSAVSKATGGSPFYLRNRMREGLREGLSQQPMILSLGAARLPARLVSMRPFEGDKNAARLGAFQELEMRFVVAEGAPGMLIAMTAATAPVAEGETPVYVEEIRLDPTQ